MNTHIITKDQLDADNNYIGSVSLADFQGSLEIESSLGWVNFSKTLNVSGCILAKAGSGIGAGRGVKAGRGIKAGLGI